MSNEPSSAGSVRGLTEADVQSKLKTEGYNELPRSGRRTPLRIILEVVRESIMALLLGGGVIYLALGGMAEALILLVFAAMSVLITVARGHGCPRPYGPHMQAVRLWLPLGQGPSLKSISGNGRQ